jgi:hypothetical protein
METKKIRKSNSEYYKSFREKNMDKIKEKHRCEICGGSYSYFTKSQHNATNKHQFHQLKETLRAQEALKNV